MLHGRVDELSKTTRVIVMRPEAVPTKPTSGIGNIGAGRGEAMIDHQAPVQSKRPAAKFDDMLKGL
jgi:hypothetical protein